MARAPLVYKDKVAGAIKRFKYENKRYMAKYFANFMAEEFERNKNEIGEIDLSYSSSSSRGEGEGKRV